MTAGEAMKTVSRATVDDLYRRVPENGKAELVDGELVRMSPTGGLPGRASAAIYGSLHRHEKEAGGGRAYPDNTGFIVDLPHRKSFSPDAAFHGDTSLTMSFVQGAPVFAAEVRSEGDYGPRAEEELARKRADYFAAGTLVVWDVDLVSDDVVRAHAAAGGEPAVFRRGETAHAEPAVPGWRMAVDALFE
jgi:Uma2 family endonuclease